MEEDYFMCWHLSDYCRLLKVSVELWGLTLTLLYFWKAITVNFTRRQLKINKYLSKFNC
jgi:hypothetical protein